MADLRPDLVHNARRERLFSPEALLPPRGVRRRMAALVLAHVLLSATPLLAGALPYYPRSEFLGFVFSAFSIGSLMLLAFWLGMGGGEFFLRLLLVGLAVLTVAFWQLFPEIVLGRSQIGGWATLEFYAYLVAMWGLFAGLVAVAFLIARIWLIVVRPLRPDDLSRRSWIKFSMLHLLAAMSLCAVIFPLIRVARSESQGAGGLLAMTLALGIGYSALFANTLAAAYAALGRKPLAPRIAVSFVAAIALGLMVSFATGHDEYGWRMILSEQLIFVVSTAVIVGSLLVVRSCGYRLMRRPKRTGHGPTNAPFSPPRASDAPIAPPLSPEVGHA